MGTFTFTCDETPATIGGINYLLYGEFEVGYSVCSAEPDVGIMSAYAEDVGISEKEFTLRAVNFETEAEAQLTFKRNTPEMQELETALQAKMDDKADEAADEAANEYDGYDD